MEGLIPFVYKAIMQYKGTGKEGPLGSWICESPSYSYMRLPGDSGRFSIQAPASFSAPSPSSNNPTSSATQIIVSSGVQSPHQCLTHRRIAAWTCMNKNMTAELSGWCLKKKKLKVQTNWFWWKESDGGLFDYSRVQVCGFKCWECCFISILDERVENNQKGLFIRLGCGWWWYCCVIKL